MRLIDADALIDEIKHKLWDWESVDGITATTVLKQTITDIENQPTALLQEQEAVVPGGDNGMCEICSFYERALPVKPVLDEQTGRMWLCGKCGSYVGFEDNDPHDPNEFDKYCRECGRPVLWEGR